MASRGWCWRSSLASSLAQSCFDVGKQGCLIVNVCNIAQHFLDKVSQEGGVDISLERHAFQYLLSLCCDLARDFQ